MTKNGQNDEKLENDQNEQLNFENYQTDKLINS